MSLDSSCITHVLGYMHWLAAKGKLAPLSLACRALGYLAGRFWYGCMTIPLPELAFVT